MELNAKPDLYNDADILSLNFYDKSKEYGFGLSRSDSEKSVEVMYRDQDIFLLEKADISLSSSVFKANFSHDTFKHIKVNIIEGVLEHSELVTALKQILEGCEQVHVQYSD